MIIKYFYMMNSFINLNINLSNIKYDKLFEDEERANEVHRLFTCKDLIKKEIHI